MKVWRSKICVIGVVWQKQILNIINTNFTKFNKVLYALKLLTMNMSATTEKSVFRCALCWKVYNDNKGFISMKHKGWVCPTCQDEYDYDWHICSKNIKRKEQNKIRYADDKP